MNLKSVICLFVLVLLTIQCKQKEPATPPEPFLPAPNKAQLNWHKAKNLTVTASSFRGNAEQYSPQMVNDGDFETFFATNDDIKDATIEIDLGEIQEVSGVILQEYIPLGKGVDGYIIECRVNGRWKEIVSGKKIGYKRITPEGRASAKDIEFPATDGVRLKIENALACPLISTFQVIGKI